MFASMMYYGIVGYYGIGIGMLSYLVYCERTTLLPHIFKKKNHDIEMCEIKNKSNSSNFPS